MGKTQDQQDKKPEAPKKSKGKPPAEKKLRGVDLPNLEDTRFFRNSPRWEPLLHTHSPLSSIYG